MHSRASEIVEELPSSVEREDFCVDTSLREPRDEDRPLAFETADVKLGATKTAFIDSDRRSDVVELSDSGAHMRPTRCARGRSEAPLA